MPTPLSVCAICLDRPLTDLPRTSLLLLRPPLIHAEIGKENLGGQPFGGCWEKAGRHKKYGSGGFSIGFFFIRAKNESQMLAKMASLAFFFAFFLYPFYPFFSGGLPRSVDWPSVRVIVHKSLCYWPTFQVKLFRCRGSLTTHDPSVGAVRVFHAENLFTVATLEGHGTGPVTQLAVAGGCVFSCATLPGTFEACDVLLQILPPCPHSSHDRTRL